MNRFQKPDSARKTNSFRRFLRPLLWRRALSPSEMFVISFLVLIAFGTLMLKFCPGLYRGDGLNWTDAVFTSTSAVCVTGLIVVDTATYFTPLGQALILLLIQLGGLGMLVLTSVMISALGGRPSLQTEKLATGSNHVIALIPARQLILDIVRFTFAIESLGALLLYLTWIPRYGFGGALWPAIFHSISAFCNAGFSTNTESLMNLQSSPMTIIIISILIIAGGLGFITLEELKLLLTRKKKIRRLSVHSKLVLMTSGLLILGGWILFAIFEWRGVLNEMSVINRLTNSFFMSVTPRTAGFNTIDYSLASDSTNFLTIILMSIGGSPGSTAGGMKTTTFALLGLLAWSRLRSHPTVTFAHRSIPGETIQRATGLFIISTGVIVFSVFMIEFIGDAMWVKPQFLTRLFETVSAFNTVGLSMGLTPDLSTPSRWLIILLMFAGRTGPLSIAAALIVRLSIKGKFRLAYEDVVVG